MFTTDAQMLEDTPAQYKVRLQAHAEKTLGAVAQAAQTSSVACETVHVEHEHPYQAIIDTADSNGCDLIVMASHGRHGISVIVVGSETVKVYPDDRATARHLLASFEPHLAEAGIGSISEVFDAEPPFTPRGCIAQAWSVAEVLRCLAKTAEERK